MSLAGRRHWLRAMLLSVIAVGGVPPAFPSARADQLSFQLANNTPSPLLFVEVRAPGEPWQA